MATDPGKTGTEYGIGSARTSPAGQRAVPISVARPVTTYTNSGELAWEEPSTGVGLIPGTRIHQYELIRELGRGGMGVVYAARDIKLGRRVAMKFLNNATREVADRFLVEARATAQCSHDNIVIIHEVDEHEGMPYMVLEFIEGHSLRDIMGEFGDGNRLPASRVVELVLPVVSALARAHELGIVHRDLKPENVLVTANGQVKVLDFGIAKALGGADGRTDRAQLADLAGQDLTLTREGTLVGTLPYMAPEQISGGVDHRADLFAVGVILFEMLTGTHPVEPLTSEALIENLVTPGRPMRSVRTVATDVPETLADIVDACLKKSKQERIASAAELARWLEILVPGRRGRARSFSADDNPYPGLTAFQESDADRFFGRTRDVSRMMARIRELPLTAVVGPSGVGKSSFIRAGVGPALKASGENWDVIALRPGRNPIASLAGIVQRFTTRTSQSFELGPEHAQLLQRLYSEPGFLGSVLRERARTNHSNILLFVDQFEELYTLVPATKERQAFTAALAGVADDPTAPLRVVVSMRSDFVDRIAEDARFLDELSRGFVFLSAPDRDGLREALSQPIEQVGYHFETSAMVEDMLDALSGTPGALPLLQFAASKLWDARDRERRLLTMASYTAIGGISGALATHADDVIAGMNAASQRLAQRVFRQLVTPERTRAIVELSDLQELGTDREGEDITRVVDQLVQARLLVVQMRADAGGSVELVHESLIDRWPTLRRWLDEDEEDAVFLAQLAVAAKQWDAKDRPHGLLWRGDAMEEARRWYTLRQRAVGHRERDFLEAVLALARRGKRARRAGLVATIVLLSAVAAGASVAYLRVRTAEEGWREAAAEANRKKAEAQRNFDQLRTKEQERQLAATAAQKAQAESMAKDVSLEESKEALRDKAEMLAKALDEAKLATERAQRASSKAELAASDAKRANEKLEQALERERSRVKQLEDEKRKLSTKLK